jgi:IS30 family transposase
MLALIRSDVSRGLSPAQIARGRADEFKVDASTIYRWIAKGYGGMSNAELRRKVGYRPRRRSTPPRQTSHGKGRSYQTFCELGEDARAAACEMDTVIGRARDSSCILTLYLRSCGVQAALLLPDRSSSAVAAALDMLETAIGKEVFRRLFGLILTDNGVEFADTEALERSAAGGSPRCKVYYCDVRQSQQKGGCERNHVELRKLLPKGRGISFDDLDGRDMACIMSQLNSEPRGRFAGLSPVRLMRAAMPDDAESLLDALGIEDVAYEDLDLTVGAIDEERRRRGLPGLL